MVEPGGQQSAFFEAQEMVAAFFRDVPALLAGLSPWQAAVFIPLGLISLLYGLKMFKGMVVVYAAMAGALIGWMVAAQFAMNGTVGCVGGAILLGLLAWPLFRYAVGVFGGFAGALLGAMLVYWMEDPVYVLVAAGIGLVGGVVLAFMVFRAVIIFMTSLIGAHLVVVGVVALVMAVPSVREPVTSGIEAKQYLLPVLVGVPAIIGAIYQIHETEVVEKKPKKKPAK